MLVRIQLLQVESKLFQQRAAVGVVFEFFQTLPGDVERSIARHDVANEALSRLPIGKQAGDVGRIGRQNQIDREAALVDGKHARGRVRRSRPDSAGRDQDKRACGRPHCPESSRENG